MKKSKFTLPVQKWGTIKSKYQPESNYVSPDEFTVGSNNFITNISGAIEKRPTDTQFNSTALSGPGTDSYEAIFTNGTHQLLFMDSGVLKYVTGPTGMTTVTSGYAIDASMEYAMFQNRVYFDNGIDNPSVYDITTSYGGVAYSPQTKNMGAQAPASIAQVTFAADSAGGNVPVGGHTYQVTFLYYGSEESNGGATSNLHTVSGSNKTVNLTNIPVGGYGVTARNIYRDNGDGNYLLIGTITDNLPTHTTFTDTISAGTTPVPSANNLPPVFSYIVLNLSRLWVAGVLGTPTTIYWSTPSLPDIFDPDNFIVCNPKDPITALAVYQGTVYVFNRHSFGQILGNTDDTFYYQEFPGSVGCTDNRSLQVRTINGVPILVWLSDRGLYAFNGSSVEYISDAIEDEVNLNIQQANFSTGSNSQSTQSDFQPGVPYPSLSPSIDINSNPGTITTVNPIRTFQSEANWESGNLTNVATNDGTNTIKVPIAFDPTLASGTLGGAAIISGSDVILPVFVDPLALPYGGPPFYSGEDFGGFNESKNMSSPSSVTKVATPFIPTRDGTMQNFLSSVWLNFPGPGSPTYTLTLRSDSLGSPGAVIWTLGPLGVGTFTGDLQFDFYGWTSIGTALTGGQTYWFELECNTPGLTIVSIAANNFNGGPIKVFSGSSWSVPTLSTHRGYFASYLWSYTITPVPSSGTWVSPIYDSYSSSITTTLTETLAGIYGSTYGATIGTVVVEGSNSPTFATVDVTETLINPNGANSLTIFGTRYWRITYNLATLDDRDTITMGTSDLTFATTATWISPTIDCTSDVVSYNPLVITDLVPSGTSVTVTVATSASSSGPWSGTGNGDGQFGPMGSTIVRQYVQVKVVLTATTDDLTTPEVSLLEFLWNLSAAFTSSIIDIGQVPTGWRVFQNVSALNGGSATFYMRSAATAGGLPAATFYQVFNGVVPNPSIIPLQYTQWRIVFASYPNQVATVDSVVVNWYIGNTPTIIRAASLFYNKTYYLAAAELGQTVNNVVIAWDQEGNWRLFRGWNINSLVLFSNLPYFLDAVRTLIYSWLVAIPTNGSGTAITMDVRTKAFDGQDYQHLKNPRSLEVMGINTGTTIHAYYSLDRGTTWIEMLNTNGVVGYTTTTDGSKFYQLFVPDYNLGNSVSGITIMYRVTSTDAYPCKILSMDPEMSIRSGKYLGMPI